MASAQRKNVRKDRHDSGSQRRTRNGKRSDHDRVSGSILWRVLPRGCRRSGGGLLGGLRPPVSGVCGLCSRGPIRRAQQNLCGENNPTDSPKAQQIFGRMVQLQPQRHRKVRPALFSLQSGPYRWGHWTNSGNNRLFLKKLSVVLLDHAPRGLWPLPQNFGILGLIGIETLG